MFTELHIKNFKSLRDVRLPLSPRLTVFVGPNNSGKSNALAALELLGETHRKAALNHAVSTLRGVRALVARGETRFELSAKGTFIDHELTYTLSGTAQNGQLEGGEETVSGTDFWLGIDPNDPNRQIKMPDGSRIGAVPGTLLAQYGTRVKARLDVQALWQELRSIQVFDLSVAKLRQASRYVNGLTLGRDGTNLAAVLDAMQGERPDLFEQIGNEVRAAAGEVKRLIIPYAQDQEEQKVVGVQENNGEVYRANEMSDGLLLFIGIAAAAAIRDGETRPSSPRLVAIEEPERGIHPRRIKEVVDYLRRLAATGAQVVLTTHSPLVLDEFLDTPECVLLFDRTAEGTAVRKLTDLPNWQDAVKGQPLGEAWYSGILGGVPR